jgi:hypothetical protein
MKMDVAVEWLSRWFRIREVQATDHFSQLGYPDWGFWWSFSVTAGKCHVKKDKAVPVLN